MEVYNLPKWQKEINKNLTHFMDIKRIKDRVKSLLDNKNIFLINNLKIFKSPLWFYKITLFDDDNYAIRIHFFIQDSIETKIHMHWFSAYSHVLAWEISEDVFEIIEINSDSRANLLNELWFRSHLLNFYWKLDPMISWPLLKNTDNDLMKSLVESLVKDFSTDSREELFIKLSLSNIPNISYTDWSIYKLNKLLDRTIESWKSYFLPAFLAHKVKVTNWTITIFIKNKTSKVWNQEFNWWNFVSLQKDAFDYIENWPSFEISDLELKIYILKSILESF